MLGEELFARSPSTPVSWECRRNLPPRSVIKSITNVNERSLRIRGTMTNANLPPKKGPNMATTTVPHVDRKSAKKALLEKVSKLMDDAEGRMSVREFEKAAKKSNDALDRIITRQKRHSATA